MCTSLFLAVFIFTSKWFVIFSSSCIQAKHPRSRKQSFSIVLLQFGSEYCSQRWAIPTPKLAIFFNGVQRKWSGVAVFLQLQHKSISCRERRKKEIFDINRCICHLQRIYIKAVHLLTINVESLCMYNRHTKETRKRERELRKIFV